MSTSQDTQEAGAVLWHCKDAHGAPLGATPQPSAAFLLMAPTMTAREIITSSANTSTCAQHVQHAQHTQVQAAKSLSDEVLEMASSDDRLNQPMPHFSACC